MVLVAPLLVASALGLLHKPSREPRVHTSLGHRQLHEGQGTRARLEMSDDDDAEVVTRVMGQAPYVALHPAEGALGYRPRRRAGHRAVAPPLGEPDARRGEGRADLALGRLPLGAGLDPGPARCSSCPRSPISGPIAEAPQPIGLIGAHRSRRDGDGSEFSSIRAFHSGDRLRRINWRVSLRQGALHVESTRAEEDAAVLLIVDAMADYGLSEGLGGQESSLDVTVRAAAAVAEQYLQGGDRVSLRVLSPGGEYAGYGTGTAHLRRILTLLARVRPGLARDVAIGQIDFRATAGTVVVVLSPMLSEALASATVRLVRRGLPVIVVDPLPPGTTPVVWPDGDPRVAELAWRMRLIDRRDLLAALASAGCPVVPWNGPRTVEEVLRRLARRTQLPRVGGA